MRASMKNGPHNAHQASFSDEALARYRDLPRPQEGLIRVIRGVEDTTASLKAISNWSRAVPGLEAFLLDIAQSPYGMGRKFNNLAKVTVTSGARPIQAQVTFFLFRQFSDQLDSHPIPKQLLWSQSLYRASLAYIIAQKAGYVDPRETLIVGLVQDMGVRLMAHLWPNDRKRLLAALAMPRSMRLQEEKRIATINHAQLLGSVARSWKLNEWFVAAISEHHLPQSSSTDRRTRRLTQLVSAADAIADIFQSQGHPECLQVATQQLAALETRSPLNLEEICLGAKKVAPSIAQAFYIPGKTQFDISLIRTAEASSPKTVSTDYQHLADQLHHMARERDELKKLLDRAYIELRALRAADTITDVANRDYFLKALGEAVKSLCRQDVPFSLVLVNLDDFTSVNTTHGYEAGDEILRQYARRVATILRPSDLIGRIGNDTLAVLLRAAAADGATIAARRCLAAVNSRPFNTPDHTSIDLTASFGGATIMPKRETMNSERLLANAEKALRDAKSVGNTIRWWHSANK